MLGVCARIKNTKLRIMFEQVESDLCLYNFLMTRLEEQKYPEDDLIDVLATLQIELSVVNVFKKIPINEPITAHTK